MGNTISPRNQHSASTNSLPIGLSAKTNSFINTNNSTSATVTVPKTKSFTDKTILRDQSSSATSAAAGSDSSSRHVPRPPPGPKPTNSSRSLVVTSVQLSPLAVPPPKRKSMETMAAWFNTNFLEQAHLGTNELYCPRCREMISNSVVKDQRFIKCLKCEQVWPVVITRMTCAKPSDTDAWVRRLVNSEILWVRMLRVGELKHLAAMLLEFQQLERSELLSRLVLFHSEAPMDSTDKEVAMQLTVVSEWHRMIQPAFCVSFLPSGLLDWLPVNKLKLDTSLTHISSTEILKVCDLSLPERIAWFQTKVNEMRPPTTSVKRIQVKRDSVFEQASTCMLTMTPNDLWHVCRYEFEGEKAMDSGGVAREFFSLVTEQTWNSSFGLFQQVKTTSGLVAYRINVNSGEANELHLQYFRFVGRLLAKALIDGYVVPAHLTHDHYKHFMGQPVSFDDLNELDSTFCKNLINVSDCQDVDSLSLDFTTSQETFGVTEQVDLVENGSQIPVTSDNVELYISCMLKHYLLDRHNAQLAFLMKGFNEVVPQALVSVFTPAEFEALISGADYIDVNDWMKNTEYRGKYLKHKQDHEVIDWFWKFVKRLDQDDCGKLLRFTTGSSRVPVLGFQALSGDDGASMKFSIDSLSFKTYRFPRAHTCFNRLELPLFETEEQLIKSLTETINFHMQGFHMD